MKARLAMLTISRCLLLVFLLLPAGTASPAEAAPRKRVLLVAPEPEQTPLDRQLQAEAAPQEISAADTVAAGKPAVGTVKAAELSEIPPPPGSDGQIWEITMELRSEQERKPWKVTIYQRVPSGAEELLTAGTEFKVGYAKRKSDRDVAIDWPGSTDGRFN